METPHTSFMRRHALVAALAVVGMSLGCSTTSFEPVPEDKVDGPQKAAAEAFGKTTLESWAKNEYTALGDEATAEFRTAQDPAGQKAADAALEAQLGDFVAMEYFQTVKSVPAAHFVYRFKGTFSKQKDPHEVRVVYDLNGKLGGFWIKPWQDQMN